MEQQPEQQKPLYKVLNEERTQGNWKADKPFKSSVEKNTFYNVIVEGPTCDKCGKSSGPWLASRSFESSVPKGEAQANAQYIALSVNNLHHLAEALEEVLNCLANAPERQYERCKIISALSRIS